MYLCIHCFVLVNTVTFIYLCLLNCMRLTLVTNLYVQTNLTLLSVKKLWFYALWLINFTGIICFC